MIIIYDISPRGLRIPSVTFESIPGLLRDIFRGDEPPKTSCINSQITLDKYTKLKPPCKFCNNYQRSRYTRKPNNGINSIGAVLFLQCYIKNDGHNI